METPNINLGKDRLYVSREQEAMVSMLAERIRDGILRDPREVQGFGQSLSHSNFPQLRRCFAAPRAAMAFGDKALNYVGGQWLRGDTLRQFGQPDVADVHVDAIMTDISIRYHNEEYIAQQVFPRVQVTKLSDKYFVFDLPPWFRDEAKVRAPATEFPEGGYTLTTDNYSVVERAIAKRVADEERDNSDSPLEPDADATEYVSDKIDLAYEKLVEDKINTSGNWTTNTTLSGTSQWSDPGSDPMAAVNTARRVVQTQIATRPNTLIMGVEVFDGLTLHGGLIDRIKYTGTAASPSMVTAQMMAQLFGVQQVLIGMAVEDTSREGGTSSISFIWGKHAWLGHVQPRPARNRVSAGYVFTTGRMADRFRHEAAKCDVIRASEAWDIKKVAAGAGYRFVNAVA